MSLITLFYIERHAKFTNGYFYNMTFVCLVHLGWYRGYG